MNFKFGEAAQYIGSGFYKCVIILACGKRFVEIWYVASQ